MGEFAVEYSVSQDAYHIDKLEQALRNNINMSLNKISNDYKILYIGTYENCKMFIEECKMC